MKKLISFILVFAMLVPAVVFADYNVSDWAVEEVARAEKNELIPSELKSADLTQNITRAEFTAVAMELFEYLNGEEPEVYEGEFTDIGGNVYEKYIRSAFKYGIVYGTKINEDGTVVFSPDEYITRQQLAAILCRVINRFDGETWIFEEADTTDEVLFADDELIDYYAKEAVYYLSKNGIVKGVSETHFSPLDTATREQAISLSMRIYDNMSKKPVKTAQPTKNPESYIGKTFDELVAEFGEPEYAATGGGWHYMFYLFGDYAFAFDGVRIFAPVDGTPVYPGDDFYEEPTSAVRGVVTTLNIWFGEDRESYTLDEICKISGIDFDIAPVEHWSGYYYNTAYDSENLFQYMMFECKGITSGDTPVIIQDTQYIYNPNEEEE